jgi:hypothetical protein
MRPQEIQVGILKRLRGTPIVRHDAEYAMVYSARPPYEILQTRDISFPEMQRMRRFARYWDLLGNSGNFVDALPLAWADGASAFVRMLALSDWLWARLRRTHEIALANLAESLFVFLTTEANVPDETAAAAIVGDWQRTGRKGVPAFLETNEALPQPKRLAPKRQARHLAT